VLEETCDEVCAAAGNSFEERGFAFFAFGVGAGAVVEEQLDEFHSCALVDCADEEGIPVRS
jgi:hypothetical protein